MDIQLQLWTMCRKMKALVVVVILIDVSQHALAVLVQAYEGMESVPLPCQYSDMLPEVPSVVWSRSDVNTTVIHLLKYKSDNLKEEYSYSERTSMKTKALESGDFSLTLRKPELFDSSNYTCSIRWETQREGTKELRLTQVQLEVKDEQEEVEVQERAESVQLPCKASADLSDDATVQWTHFDPQRMVVHVFRNKTDHLQTQDRFYFGRTEMKKDMSLTLRNPTDRDRGVYICTVYRKGDVLRSKVLLQLVKEGFPTWAIVVLVFLVLLILLSIILITLILLGVMSCLRLVEEVQHPLAVLDSEMKSMLQDAIRGNSTRRSTQSCDDPRTLGTVSTAMADDRRLRSDGGGGTDFPKTVWPLPQASPPWSSIGRMDPPPRFQMGRSMSY